MLELASDAAAVDRVGAADIVALTESAIEASFFRAELTSEQIEANARIVAISGPTAMAAAENRNQHLAVAFANGLFAGYVISTVHAEDERELDWLMVHPDFHGTAVSATLMRAGMAWLGEDRAMWLTVIQFNTRAIAFYRKFGFEIDPAADIERVIPHFIMRRPAGPLQPIR